MKTFQTLATVIATSTVLLSTPAVAEASSIIDLQTQQPRSYMQLPFCTTGYYEVILHLPPRDVIAVPFIPDHNFDCKLGRGSTGRAVQALQETLNFCHGAGIAEDGNYGPGTENAIRNVQRKLGVSADGWYGPATRDPMHFKSINPEGPHTCEFDWPHPHIKK